MRLPAALSPIACCCGCGGVSEAGCGASFGSSASLPGVFTCAGCVDFCCGSGFCCGSLFCCGVVFCCGAGFCCGADFGAGATLIVGSSALPWNTLITLGYALPFFTLA